MKPTVEIVVKDGMVTAVNTSKDKLTYKLVDKDVGKSKVYEADGTNINITNNK